MGRLKEVLTLALASERISVCGGGALLLEGSVEFKGYPFLSLPPSDENGCVLLPEACGSASCHNTLGSFHCVCPSGFDFDQTLGSCQDVDNCAAQWGPYSYSCSNTPGGFLCGCPQGYFQGEGLEWGVHRPSNLGSVCTYMGLCTHTYRHMHRE